MHMPHTSALPHASACNYAYRCVPTRVQMCAITHTDVCHHSHQPATGIVVLVVMRKMIVLVLMRNSCCAKWLRLFLCAKWLATWLCLTHLYVMSHTWMCHVSPICVMTHSQARLDSFGDVTRLIETCTMTHTNCESWHEPVTRLIETCAMTHTNLRQKLKFLIRQKDLETV